MELIVAVYDDWGIGREGTQPIALSADRKFFRETTRGATVIVGRRTIEDFPGKKPLPGRVNLAMSCSEAEIPGFTVCHSPEEVLARTKNAPRAFVIGGGSVYRQMLPYCDRAYVTKGTPPRNPTPFSPIWTKTRTGFSPRPSNPARKTALLTKCCCIAAGQPKAGNNS